MKQKKIYYYLIFVSCLTMTARLSAQEFITRWNLTNPGSSSTSIGFEVTTIDTVYYTWETIPAGISGTGTFSGTFATITGLPINAIIRLKIDSTNFKGFRINYGADRKRIVDVEQWGTVVWSSMESAFKGCDSLQITASDVPNLSSVSNMYSMFSLATTFNSPIGNWNVDSVTNMAYMFEGASSFNQPIDTWNTINVSNMYSMFYYASSFN